MKMMLFVSSFAMTGFFVGLNATSDITFLCFGSLYFSLVFLIF